MVLTVVKVFTAHGVLAGKVQHEHGLPKLKPRRNGTKASPVKLLPSRLAAALEKLRWWTFVSRIR